MNFFDKQGTLNNYFQVPTDLIAFADLHKVAERKNHSEFIYRDGAFYSSATDTIAYARSESYTASSFLSVSIETDYDSGYVRIVKCYHYLTPAIPVNNEQFDNLVVDLKNFEFN